MNSSDLKCAGESLAHHEAAEVVGKVIGDRTGTPWSTATSRLAEKMMPMPSIHLIPE
jgi:hypothetical protein